MAKDPPSNAGDTGSATDPTYHGHLSLPAATADLTTTEPGHSRACVPKREKLTQHKEDLAWPKANK